MRPLFLVTACLLCAASWGKVEAKVMGVFRITNGEVTAWDKDGNPAPEFQKEIAKSLASPDRGRVASIRSAAKGKTFVIFSFPGSVDGQQVQWLGQDGRNYTESWADTWLGTSARKFWRTAILSLPTSALPPLADFNFKLFNRNIHLPIAIKRGATAGAKGKSIRVLKADLKLPKAMASEEDRMAAQGYKRMSALVRIDRSQFGKEYEAYYSIWDRKGMKIQAWQFWHNSKPGQAPPGILRGSWVQQEPQGFPEVQIQVREDLNNIGLFAIDFFETSKIGVKDVALRPNRG